MEEMVETTEKTTTSTSTNNPIAQNAAIERAPRKVEVNHILVAQIQRCIQRPEFCNNRKMDRTTISSPSTTTQNPVELARNCVINGDCQEHEAPSSEPNPNDRIFSPTLANELELRVRLCLFAGVC